jgi:hypothetical protein
MYIHKQQRKKRKKSVTSASLKAIGRVTNRMHSFDEVLCDKNKSRKRKNLNKNLDCGVAM